MSPTWNLRHGESLVNDASALILYRAAVAAVVGGGFDLSRTLVEFAVAGVGGVAIGDPHCSVASPLRRRCPATHRSPVGGRGRGRVSERRVTRGAH